MASTLSRPLNSFVTFGVGVGLLAIALPTLPANAARNPYQFCASRLLAVGISAESASIACAEALKPEEVGICVIRITRQQGIEALDALAACRQVRRPVEMASCVTQIRDRATDLEALAVLDTCRRSLLPLRLADCVVGTSRATNLNAPVILNNCISGSDTPREFGPTFIPTGGLPLSPVPAAPDGTLPAVPPQTSPAPEGQTAPAPTSGETPAPASGGAATPLPPGNP